MRCSSGCLYFCLIAFVIAHQYEYATVISHKDVELLIVHDVAVPVCPVGIVPWIEAYIEVVLAWLDEVGLTYHLEFFALHPSTHCLTCAFVNLGGCAELNLELGVEHGNLPLLWSEVFDEVVGVLDLPLHKVVASSEVESDFVHEILSLDS